MSSRAGSRRRSWRPGYCTASSSTSGPNSTASGRKYPAEPPAKGKHTRRGAPSRGGPSRLIHRSSPPTCPSTPILPPSLHPGAPTPRLPEPTERGRAPRRTSGPRRGAQQLALYRRVRRPASGVRRPASVPPAPAAGRNPLRAAAVPACPRPQGQRGFPAAAARRPPRPVRIRPSRPGRLPADHPEEARPPGARHRVRDGRAGAAAGRPGRRGRGRGRAGASLDVARAKPGAERARWITGGGTARPPPPVDLATMTGNAAQALGACGLGRGAARDVRGAAARRVPGLGDPRSGPAGLGGAEPRGVHGGGARARRRRRRELGGSGRGRPAAGDVPLDVRVRGGRAGADLGLDAGFRERAEVEAGLAAHGHLVEDVREAPDRNRPEFVFLARRPESGTGVRSGGTLGRVAAGCAAEAGQGQARGGRRGQAPGAASGVRRPSVPRVR